MRHLGRWGTTVLLRVRKRKKSLHFKPFFRDFLGHLLRFRKQPFFQKHLLTVGKPKRVGEHPISGAERVLLTDIAVNQHPDFFRQFHFFQPAGISFIVATFLTHAKRCGAGNVINQKGGTNKYSFLIFSIKVSIIIF